MKQNIWNKVTVLMLAVLLLAVFIGCGKKSDTVTIGAVLPLTGPIAQNGKFYRQGLELALQDAIKNGIITEGKIKLIVEDGQADPRLCVDAFKKLINVNKIIAAFGSTSAVSLAMKPISNTEHIVLINASAISVQIEDSADFVFSVLPNAGIEGAFLAETAYKKMGKRNVGILFRNDQSGQSFQVGFASKFKELGGQIILNEGHQPDLTDFRTLITKVKANPIIDLVFVASFWTETATYARQAKELGVTVPILTYETYNNPKVFEVGGDAANGVMFCASAFDINSNDSTIKAFQNSFKSLFPNDVNNFYVAFYYDGMMMLIKGIASGAKTGSTLKDYMNNLRTYKGISGEMTFDTKGAVNIPLAIYEAKNKEFSKVDFIH